MKNHRGWHLGLFILVVLVATLTPLYYGNNIQTVEKELVLFDKITHDLSKSEELAEVTSMFKTAAMLHLAGDLFNAKNNYLLALQIYSNHENTLNEIEIGDHTRKVKMLTDQILEIKPYELNEFEKKYYFQSLQSLSDLIYLKNQIKLRSRATVKDFINKKVSSIRGMLEKPAQALIVIAILISILFILFEKNRQKREDFIKEINKALEDSRKKVTSQLDDLKSLITHMPSILAYINDQKEIEVASDEWYKTLLPHQPHAKAQSFKHKFPNTFSFWSPLIQRLEKGEAVQMENVEYRSEDGRVLFLNIKTQPIDRDEVGGGFLMVEDVTAKYTLAQKEAKLRKLLENSIEFSFEIDHHLKIVSASGELSSLFDQKDLIGRPFLELIEIEDHRKNVEQLFKTSLSEQSDSRDQSIWFRRGEKPLCMAMSFIYLKQSKGIAGICKNITDRALASEALREGQRLAEEANETKSIFLANISHELRTPMHGVLSFAEIGMEEWDHAPREDLLDSFQEIYTTGKRLMKLLNDLLDLSKLEAGRMEYNMVKDDLSSIVNAVSSQLGVYAKGRNVELTLEKEGQQFEIDADESRIFQVLSNVIGNAIKFSNPNTAIHIKLTSSAQETQIAIHNTGPQIPTDELETIFSPFHQSRATRTKAGGTGLGLAICQQIITDHHGKIWAENTPNGVIFKISFPSPTQIKAA